MTVLALIGAKALWLTYVWLASAIAASWISERKGYSERAGLAAGLLLSAVGVVVWLRVAGARGFALEARGTAAAAAPVTRAHYGSDSSYPVIGTIPNTIRASVAQNNVRAHEERSLRRARGGPWPTPWDPGPRC